MSGPPLLSADYGGGSYRRRIVLVGGPRSAVGELEDDFHHVRARVRHDGARVSAIEGQTPRIPWTTCPLASAPLKQLVGAPLAPRIADVAAHADPRVQCTHLFDVALLTIAHAAAGRGRRSYDIEIPDRREQRTVASLRRDGVPLLEWQVEGDHVRSPAPFAGHRLRGTRFPAFLHEQLSPDDEEAALLLRRACYIALGRSFHLDGMDAPGEAIRLARCHTFSAAQLPHARRNRGTSLDFTRHPEALVASDPPLEA